MKRDWLALEEERVAKGLSVKEFCKDKGILTPSYYQGRRNSLQKPAAKEKPKFCEINTAPAVIEGPTIRLATSSGLVVELFL